MNWEIRIDMYTLICIKRITNKNLLYKKINKRKFKKKRKNKAAIIIKKKKKNLFIYFGRSMRDPSSPTRDLTCTPCSGSVES